MVNIHKFSEKVCEICRGKKACGRKASGVIINAGDNSPAARPGQRTKSVRKTDRKEQMEEELLFGKYRILKLLANGSGGEVFLAEHKVLGERRIIKRLSKNRPFYRERLKEAHTLKTLHHAAIPCIFDIEEDESAFYMIEEDMGGETLNEFLIRQKCLPTSLISHYSIQLCEIIEYLHQNGILYLDVKPDNIMICGEKLSLIDFGSAFQKKERQHVVFGTDGYAAPEQYSGKAEERSDIYGIGSVIGVMLGVGNKEGTELRKIYERCVQPIPERRYPDVSALKEDLQRFCCRTQKRAKKSRGSYPRYVGVTGVHEGAESAALCTLLAGHFSEREKGRVACIDLSGHMIFGWLYESLFGTGKPVPEEFSLHGVSYVTGEGSSTIGNCAVRGFSVIVIHFGVLSGRFRDEFFRCDSRFVLGSLYPWRLQDWRNLLKLLPGMDLQREITAVITGGEKEMLPLRVHKVIELPFVRDVLYTDRKTERWIRALF